MSTIKNAPVGFIHHTTKDGKILVNIDQIIMYEPMPDNAGTWITIKDRASVLSVKETVEEIIQMIDYDRHIKAKRK